MSVELYLAFIAASAVLLLVPGPTVLLVIAHALREGRRATIRTCLGVVAGDAFAVTISLAGKGALIAASATLFILLKWAGAAYLIWPGIRTLMERRSEPGPEQAADAVSNRKLASRAFIVTALNPKSIAFFVAFLPQFVDPGAAVAPQFSCLVQPLSLSRAQRTLVLPWLVRVHPV